MRGRSEPASRTPACLFCSLALGSKSCTWAPRRCSSSHLNYQIHRNSLALKTPWQVVCPRKIHSHPQRPSERDKSDRSHSIHRSLSQSDCWRQSWPHDRCLATFSRFCRDRTRANHRGGQCPERPSVAQYYSPWVYDLSKVRDHRAYREFSHRWGRRSAGNWSNPWTFSRCVCSNAACTRRKTRTLYWLL